MFKTLSADALTAALKAAKYKGPKVGETAQCISNNKIYTGTMERFAHVVRQGKVVALVGFMLADGGAHTVRLEAKEFEAYTRPPLERTAETPAELAQLVEHHLLLSGEFDFDTLPPEPTAADAVTPLAEGTKVRVRRADGSIQRAVVRGYAADGKVRVTIGTTKMKVKPTNVLPLLPAAPKAAKPKVAKTKAAPAKPTAPKSAPKTTSVKIKLGAKVKARWAQDGKFYGAKFVGLVGTKARIEWADGSGKATVALADVRA